MKAIVYHKYGSPDELQLEEVETPTPKNNEVLVKVKAASINSWDWDLVIGKPYIYRLLFGFPKPKFPIIGSDISGVVETVGKDVKQFQPGDEVFGDISSHGFGAFAEYASVPEKMLTLKSPAMTFEEAAAIPQAGVLAIQCFLDKQQVQADQKILINGAGGGVGTFSIQIAKSFGAEVTAVDSAGKLEIMQSLGADHVMDYTKQDFTKTGKLYNLVIDVVTQRSIREHRRALKPGGLCWIVGGKVNKLLQTVAFGSIGSDKKVKLLVHEPNRYIDEIIRLFEAEKVKPIIDSQYPLEETRSAMRHFGTGKVKGKIIITI